MKTLKRKYILYIDLDGVLTDFDLSFQSIAGVSVKDYISSHSKDLFPLWKIIEGNLKFWTDMEWTDGGRIFWKYVKEYDPIILSAPTPDPVSHEGKKLWVRENLGNVPIILDENKSTYASLNSILVDDLNKNLDKWKLSGGIPVLYEGCYPTISKLKELGV